MDVECRARRPASARVASSRWIRYLRECAKICGEYATSDHLAGALSPYWAEQLGLKAGIPIPVGAFTRTGTIGVGCRTGDLVNVVGTSTCIIGITPSVNLVPGVCGVVEGSVNPKLTGIEAGLSAVGDIFNAIATRAGRRETLTQSLENYRAGQTGLLRVTTGTTATRAVLVNPNLRGVTLGWNLQSTAQDELFAAIEGTALHTRVILDRMAENGVQVERVINAGGIRQKETQCSIRFIPNVLGRPVLVPSKSVVSLGSAIFAFEEAGTFKAVEEAQEQVCSPHKEYLPDSYIRCFASYTSLSGRGEPSVVRGAFATEPDITLRNATLGGIERLIQPDAIGEEKGQHEIDGAYSFKVIIAMSIPSQSKVTKQAVWQDPDGTPVELYTLQDGKITVRIMTYGGIVQSRSRLRTALASPRTLCWASTRSTATSRLARSPTWVPLSDAMPTALPAELSRLTARPITSPRTMAIMRCTAAQTGFNKKAWTGKEIKDGVELTYVSKNGEEGFPGTLTTTVRYTLSGNELRIEYSATTDKDTVLNLTNHSYFNLKGQGKETSWITR